MKLITLVENTACGEHMIPQHGLSLYLETGGRKILFDMGQDDTFLKNAQALGVDLSQVDLAILSHGHYDHGGGLETFLNINSKAAVFLHEQAFGAYYNGTEKYIGLPMDIRENPRLIFTKGKLQIAPGLTLYDCNDLGWESDPWGLNRREGEHFVPDLFFHEQYLEVTEGKKKILISGCSHKGIGNIAAHFRPDVLIGGFHLNKLEAEDKLLAIAQWLLAEPTEYYTGHCTGERQYIFLKQQMGDRLQRLSAGSILKV